MTQATQKGSEFKDVRSPNTGKLLFKYSPKRDIVKIRAGGKDYTIDLEEFREASADDTIQSKQQVAGMLRFLKKDPEALRTFQELLSGELPENTET